jgi:hypothetical protein
LFGFKVKPPPAQACGFHGKAKGHHPQTPGGPNHRLAFGAGFGGIFKGPEEEEEEEDDDDDDPEYLVLPLGVVLLLGDSDLDDKDDDVEEGSEGGGGGGVDCFFAGGGWVGGEPVGGRSRAKSKPRKTGHALRKKLMREERTTAAVENKVKRWGCVCVWGELIVFFPLHQKPIIVINVPKKERVVENYRRL